MGVRSVHTPAAGVTYRPLFRSTDTPRDTRVADGDDDVEDDEE